MAVYADRLWGANMLGQQRVARQVHVVDHQNLTGQGAGKFVPAVQVSWFDSNEGRFERIWPNTPVIESFTAAVQELNWQWVDLAWSVTGSPFSYTLTLNGTVIESGYGQGAGGLNLQWCGGATLYAYPQMNVEFELNMMNQQGTVSKSVFLTLPKPPAPSWLRLDTVSTTAAQLTVAEVVGVESYTLERLINGIWVDQITQVSRVFNIIVEPSQSYSFRARATWGWWNSDPSPVRTFTTGSTSTFTAGVYTILPESIGFAEFDRNTGEQVWAAPAAYDFIGQRAENANKYKLGFFFYGDNISSVIPAALAGRTVTKFEVQLDFLTPNTDSQSWSPLVWWLHSYLTRPASIAPFSMSWTSTPTGVVGTNAVRWIELPTSLAVDLCTPGGFEGLALGLEPNTNRAWLDADLLAAVPTGALRITVS